MNLGIFQKTVLSVVTGICREPPAFRVFDVIEFIQFSDSSANRCSSPCWREGEDNKQLRCWRHRALPCMSPQFTHASRNSRSPPSHHALLAPGTMDSACPRDERHTPCWRVRGPSRHMREGAEKRRPESRDQPTGVFQLPCRGHRKLGRI